MTLLIYRSLQSRRKHAYRGINPCTVTLSVISALLSKHPKSFAVSGQMSIQFSILFLTVENGMSLDLSQAAHEGNALPLPLAYGINSHAHFKPGISYCGKCRNFFHHSAISSRSIRQRLESVVLQLCILKSYVITKSIC